MKSWTTKVVLLVMAICVAILGTHTTTAQQATSGSASTTISSSALAPPAAYRTSNTTADPWAIGGDQDPLQQADRSHTESTRRLLADYQATTDADERKKLSGELENLITEHFEIRQKIRAQELEELQAQVRRLQELHERREQEKNQIISDRLRQMLRDAEGLGWGSSDGASIFGAGTQRTAPYAQPVRSIAPATVPR